MADLDKIYEMTVENNTNIKHMIEDHQDFKNTLEVHDKRLEVVENKDKKTAKEHILSFSKVCGAFLVIGSLFTLIVKLSEKLWP
jgi:hypothetical protein